MRLVIALLLVVFILALFLSIPPPTAYASEARCVNTLITSPTSHSVLSGVVNINGTAQLVGAFVRYQVDFSTTGLNLWVTLNSAPQAVVNGTLARWDTSLVPDGDYDLRVRSVDTSGNYCEMLVSPITVKKGESNIFSNTKLVAQPVASTIEIKTLSGKLEVPIPAAPTIPYCTSAASLGSVVTRSIRLCAGQTYRPFQVVGNSISILGDTAGTAVIRSYGRSFGIVVQGNYNLISGVRIIGTTAESDAGKWLCLYEQCDFAGTPVTGGVNYGGGILLKGSGNTVMNSAISGGVIGIATIETRGNNVLNNELTDLTGWGIFGVGAADSVFVGNTLHDVNRACVDPGGHSFVGGCESAGMVLMGANMDLIANNTCARSGNCYYLNGDGGRVNTLDKLYGNSCAAPSFNCFEITDADSIEFDGNMAWLTPDNGAGCEIWLVRAHITIGLNNQVHLCNHHGSKLESTFEPPK